MTKPTKWVCAQQRLRSAWASAHSDQSSLCAQWVAKDPSFFHVDSEDSDQTGRMPRPIWVFTGHTVTLLVLSWGGSYHLLEWNWQCYEKTLFQLGKTFLEKWSPCSFFTCVTEAGRELILVSMSTCLIHIFFVLFDHLSFSYSSNDSKNHPVKVFNCVFESLRPVKIKTSLLSYRD